MRKIETIIMIIILLIIIFIMRKIELFYFYNIINTFVMATFEMVHFNSDDFEGMNEQQVLMILDKLSPIDLLNFITTCKKNFQFVISRIDYFVEKYYTELQSPLEKFMWSYCFSEQFLIKDKQYVFLKILQIHKFTISDIIEKIHKFPDWDWDIVSLTTDPNELYIKKLQLGLAYAFINERCNIGVVLELNENTFIFFFKFVIKYKNAEYHLNDAYYLNMLVSKGMTFEETDEFVQEALSYGGEEEHIYEAINYGLKDSYIRLIKYCVESESAIKFGINFVSEQELETYKCLHYIIGKTFAFEFIIKQHLNVDDYPFLLTHLSKLYSMGINNLVIANKIMNSKPSDEVYESLKMQMDIFGDIKYNKDFIFTPYEIGMFNNLANSVGKHFAYYIVKNIFTIDIDKFPNSLENLAKLYSAGINDKIVAERFIKNPSEELFDKYSQQIKTNGKILFWYC